LLEEEERRMLDGEFRNQIEAWVRPVGASAKRAGIPADLITVTGLIMAVAAAVSIAAGSLNLGLLFLVLTGIPDLVDGAVAKASGTASERGAFLDSVTDRVTDGLLFGGIAWYFTTISDGPLPVLPFAVFMAASLVSYIRAKADALGFDARGGLVERAERFILLAFGLLFSDLLVAVLWVILGLSLLTAVQRFAKVWRQAWVPRVRPARTARRRRSVAETSAAQRWRARRLDARARAQERAAQRRLR
jgi:CDP-diacylglycerol--glycerol-3-phosphate 3-phosphatidyltransferase